MRARGHRGSEHTESRADQDPSDRTPQRACGPFDVAGLIVTVQDLLQDGCPDPPPVLAEDVPAS